MKTIEEAAKEYAETYVPTAGYNKFDAPYLTRFEHNSDVELAFEEGINFAQQWIPCEKELPEEEFGFYKPVLVLIEGYGLCSSAAYKNGKFIPDNPVIDVAEITHWRPIEYK